MRVFMFGWLCVFSLFGGMSLTAAETVTAGGIAVMIPDGWDHADADGRVVLTPRDLPQGVGCTLTLLGGKALEGSVTDHLTAAWDGVASKGKVIWDDKGKVDGAGNPIEVASRAGIIELDGVQFHVWAVAYHANGRVALMLLASNKAETFNKYTPAVAALIQSAKSVPVAAAPAAVKMDAPAAGVFGHVRYTVPPGWTEKRDAGGVVFSLSKPIPDEVLEFRLMKSRPAAGNLSDATATAWADAFQVYGAQNTDRANDTKYKAEPAQKSFKGWEYVRATGLLSANKDEYFLGVMVIKINDRIERLLIISMMRNHHERGSLYDSAAHKQMIDEFIFGMKFDDWKDPVVEPGL